MAVEFNNTASQYIDFGAILSGYPQKTWVFTLKPGSAANGYILGKVSASNQGWHIYTNTSGVCILDYDFTVSRGQWVTPALTIGVNNRIVWTFDASSAANNPLCWINGASKTVTETSTPSGTADELSSNSFRIGDLPVGSYLSVDGMVEDVRVYSGIATQSMAASDYSYFSASNYNADAFTGLTPLFWCPLKSASGVGYMHSGYLDSYNILKDLVGCATGTPAGFPRLL